MVMERLVLQMVSDSESEGNSKIYKRGLVHAALCDGPLKQVASMRLLIVGLGRVRKSQGRQLISKMYTDNQNLQRCRGKRHNSKKKKKRVHEREQIDQVAGYTTPFPLLWSLIALN